MLYPFFTIQVQKSTPHTKSIRRKHPIRISLPPRLPQAFILLLRLKIRVPNGIEIELAKRTPQNAAILLAKDALRADSFLLVTHMPQDRRVVRSFTFVERVERATYGGVAPGIRRTIVRVCGEFGMLATEALDLSRDVASVQVRLYESIDALCKPFGPLVFHQGGRIGEMGAFDVRQLEFADVAEDPVGGELRHGLDFVLGVDGMFGDGFEPAVVRAVLRAKGHPLRIDNNRARPDLNTVFAVDLRVLVFLEVVSFGDEGWELEGGREDTDTEVVVAREVGVVRHGREEGEERI